MVNHVPDQMRRLKGIRRFSGQGIYESLFIEIIILHRHVGTETNNNDDARKNYISSNHLDGPRNILLMEEKLEKLAQYKRTKRSYNKVNTEYWEEDIYRKRKRTDEATD